MADGLENVQGDAIPTDELRARAQSAREQDKPLEAWEHLQAALAVDRREHGETHPNVILDLNNLASVFQELGDMGGARQHYELALDRARQHYGDDDENVAIIHNNWAVCYWSWETSTTPSDILKRR